MSQYLLRHDRLTPDSALSLSGRCVGVPGFFSALVVVDKNRSLWISLTDAKKLCSKIPQKNRFGICDKNKDI